MKKTTTRIGLVALEVVLLVWLLAFVGCQNRHPEVKQAVNNSLSQHDLRSREVFEDRLKSEITLQGSVVSAEQRASAEKLTELAAPGYSIKDLIRVQSAGSRPKTERSI